MLAFKLGLRFFKSKRYGSLAKFMSFASTSGIAIGVFALIVGLSAMNGFEYELENRVLSVIPNGRILSQHENFTKVDEDIAILKQDSAIIGATKAIEKESVLIKGSSFVPAMLIGLDIAHASEVINLDPFINTSLNKLDDNSDTTIPIILGAQLAKKLQLKEGDIFNIMSLNMTENQQEFGQTKQSSVKLIGIMEIGGQIDSAFIFTSFDNALKITSLEDANAIYVKNNDFLRSTEEILRASQNFKEPAYLQSWMLTQGKLYKDIQMIRGIMYIAMILVITVASFNIISNLIMSVSEKSQEIAILLTIGAKRSLIVKAFSIMGVLSGTKGILIGAILGSAFASCLAPLSIMLKDKYGIVILNPDVYFIDFIPAILSWSDVFLVAITAVIMSFLASIYPAIKASKIKPSLELN